MDINKILRQFHIETNKKYKKEYHRIYSKNYREIKKNKNMFKECLIQIRRDYIRRMIIRVAIFIPN